MNDLRRMGDLVSNMRENWGMLGLPTCFQFSNDGKKLYFLADTSGKGNEIHYVNISDEGAHLLIHSIVISKVIRIQISGKKIISNVFHHFLILRHPCPARVESPALFERKDPCNSCWGTFKGGSATPRAYESKFGFAYFFAPKQVRSPIIQSLLNPNYLKLKI